MKRYTIVGLGEVLLDIFASHKQLGGAPANFAYMCGLLGDEGCVASRIGIDPLGSELLERLGALEIPTSYVQLDDAHPTGTVKVDVAADGQPRFDITRWVAWDFLAWTAEWKALARRADAVCFGSLAQREPQSASTIQRFVNAVPKKALRVFDINLRQNFYSREMIAASADAADILKLNQEELPLLLTMFNGPSLEQLSTARWLCNYFRLKMVCLTRGANGSLLATPNAFHEHNGHRVQVADTVGAGDAFTAAFVDHYLRGSDLGTMNDAANRMGAWVASTAGGTPALEAEVVEKVRAHSA